MYEYIVLNSTHMLVQYISKYRAKEEVALDSERPSLTHNGNYILHQPRILLHAIAIKNIFVPTVFFLSLSLFFNFFFLLNSTTVSPLKQNLD